ncbi:MAG TPA: hypothetical protein VL336_08765 [Sphingomicrobium sp.]|jgi:hypothetical protein|nr:hypothetical protein [Sphingomicrobium sp.]
MDDDPNKPSNADEQLEREIRQGRKFNPQEALARMAGPGAMKGASPVSQVQQAEAEIGTWLASNMVDTGGALKVVLHRHLKGSRLLLDNLEQPLTALAGYCRAVLENDSRLTEIVREADVEWGRAMDERPHFDREGIQPSPDDPYTSESVRRALDDVLTKIPGETG